MTTLSKRLLVAGSVATLLATIVLVRSFARGNGLQNDDPAHRDATATPNETSPSTPSLAALREQATSGELKSVSKMSPDVQRLYLAGFHARRDPAFFATVSDYFVQTTRDVPAEVNALDNKAILSHPINGGYVLAICAREIYLHDAPDGLKERLAASALRLAPASDPVVRMECAFLLSALLEKPGTVKITQEMTSTLERLRKNAEISDMLRRQVAATREEASAGK